MIFPSIREGFLAEKLFRRLILMAHPVLWLACEVQFHPSPAGVGWLRRQCGQNRASPAQSGPYDASAATRSETRPAWLVTAGVRAQRGCFGPCSSLTTPMWPNAKATISYDASVVNKSPPGPEHPPMNRRRHNRTTAAWLFGDKLRRERGQTPKTPTAPVRPFLRCQKSS